MTVTTATRCTAFDRDKLISQGTAGEVRAALTRYRGQNPYAAIVVFDDETGEDFDLEGTRALASPPAEDPDADPAVKLVTASEPARAGRPKLGVIAREVTLLPRHWEWLETQSGGASVALRKLVEAARKQQAPEDRVRRAVEVTYRFLSVKCGSKPGFEEIARELFRRNWHEFDSLIAALPDDVSRHLKMLSQKARPEREEIAEH